MSNLAHKAPNVAFINGKPTHLRRRAASVAAPLLWRCHISEATGESGGARRINDEVDTGDKEEDNRRAKEKEKGQKSARRRWHRCDARSARLGPEARHPVIIRGRLEEVRMGWMRCTVTTIDVRSRRRDEGGEAGRRPAGRYRRRPNRTSQKKANGNKPRPRVRLPRRRTSSRDGSIPPRWARALPSSCELTRRLRRTKAEGARSSSPEDMAGGRAGAGRLVAECGRGRQTD